MKANYFQKQKKHINSQKDETNRIMKDKMFVLNPRKSI